MYLSPGTWRTLLMFSFYIIRAIWRLILLWKHHGGIQPIPPIAPLDRDKYTKQFKHNPTEVKPFTDNTARISYDFKNIFFIIDNIHLFKNHRISLFLYLKKMIDTIFTQKGNARIPRKSRRWDRGRICEWTKWNDIHSQTIRQDHKETLSR